MQTRIIIAMIALVGVFGTLSTPRLVSSAEAACSGNPHDFDSGPNGNPHDSENGNLENGNPHDLGSDFRHHGSEGCPGAK
ncbi:MAG TPA: hypothetical protein VFI73_13395 [Candidatus Nitrosopolaris sp.]|nr:hypothetical protein [Candidatus Nitrosopolaris sp.]